jgi:hypothetical protein
MLWADDLFYQVQAAKEGRTDELLLELNRRLNRPSYSARIDYVHETSIGENKSLHYDTNECLDLSAVNDNDSDSFHSIVGMGSDVELFESDMDVESSK